MIVLSGLVEVAPACAEGVQKLDEVEITGKQENAVGVWDAASQGVVTGEESNGVRCCAPAKCSKPCPA